MTCPGPHTVSGASEPEQRLTSPWAGTKPPEPSQEWHGVVESTSQVAWVQIPAPSISSKALSLSVPQFSHLESGADSSNCLTGLLWGPSESMNSAVSTV